MIKPHFLAVLVLGKSPEGLILLDLITTDNAFPSRCFGCSVDVEDLILRSSDKFLSFVLDPLTFRGIRGCDILRRSHCGDLLVFFVLGSEWTFFHCVFTYGFELR